MSHQIISLGYERRNIDEFIAILKSHKVSKVIDIREAPISRRVDYRKNILSSHLSDESIDYQHIKAAGNPYRKEKGDIDFCLNLYSSYLSENPQVLSLVADEITNGAVAILCYEREHRECHRSILIDFLSEVVPDIDLVKVE